MCRVLQLAPSRPGSPISKRDRPLLRLQALVHDCGNMQTLLIGHFWGKNLNTAWSPFQVEWIIF